MEKARILASLTLKTVEDMLDVYNHSQRLAGSAAWSGYALRLGPVLPQVVEAYKESLPPGAATARFQALVDGLPAQLSQELGPEYSDARFYLVHEKRASRLGTAQARPDVRVSCG